MLGPTIGGLLISVWEWPLIFLINVPVGMIGCLIVAYLVPGNKTDITKQSFDIVGTVILTLSLTCNFIPPWFWLFFDSRSKITTANGGLEYFSIFRI